MWRNPFRRFFFKLPLFIFIVICCNNGITQRDSTKNRFYGGVEMGAAGLDYSSDNINDPIKARYSLWFYGGYSPVNYLRIGLNLGGYLIESYGNYDNPDKGISISNIHIQSQVFPFSKRRLLFNIQGGFSNYINHNVNGYNSKGFSLKTGFGYEYPVKRRLGLALMLNYGYGRFKDVNNLSVNVTRQQFNALEISVCVTFK